MRCLVLHRRSIFDVAAAAIAAGEVGAFSLLDDASMSDAQVFSDLFTRLFMLPSSSSKMFWARTTSASAIINLVRTPRSRPRRPRPPKPPSYLVEIGPWPPFGPRL